MNPRSLKPTPANNRKLSNDLDNITCPICRPIRMVCKGHAKGSSGSGGGNNTQSEKKADTANIKALRNTLMNSANWTSLPETDSFKFEKEQAPLSLELDLGNGQLKIIQNYSVVSQDQDDVKNYIDLVLNELNIFKQALTNQGISIGNITTTTMGNTLVVNMGSKLNFDGFIQQLVNKGILPVNAISMKEQHLNNSQMDRGYSSSPSPLSSRPIPR